MSAALDDAALDDVGARVGANDWSTSSTEPDPSQLLWDIMHHSNNHHSAPQTVQELTDVLIQVQEVVPRRCGLVRNVPGGCRDCKQVRH